MSGITLTVTSEQADMIAMALHRMETQERVARSVALARGADRVARALDLRVRAIERLRLKIDKA